MTQSTEGLDPNDYQIDGRHYEGVMQHWDFAAANFGPGYFLGQATKYVCRWKKKNGLVDLNKARHFLVKYESINWQVLGYANRPVIAISPAKFCQMHQLDDLEARIIFYITAREIPTALKALDQLIRIQAILDDTDPLPEVHLHKHHLNSIGVMPCVETASAAPSGADQFNHVGPTGGRIADAALPVTPEEEQAFAALAAAAAAAAAPCGDDGAPGKGYIDQG